MGFNINLYISLSVGLRADKHAVHED